MSSAFSRTAAANAANAAPRRVRGPAVVALVVVVGLLGLGTGVSAADPAGGAAVAPPAPLTAPAAPAAGNGSAAGPAVDQAVAAVQGFYDQSQTFKSDFQQKFWVKAYNQEKSSRGRVTFAKPGKMDWVYDDPKDNRVVSDGAVIKVYEASNKQMYEQPITKSQYPAALSFLTGTGKLADNFDFQLVSGPEMKFPGGYVLIGTPKQLTPAYSKVLFYVDAPTSQVRRVMVIDGQGNRNRFDFSNPRVNESVPPAEFAFVPPAGTSVVHP